MTQDQISYKDRPKHIYVPGEPGYGKTTFLYWRALLDIQNGCGVTVIDGGVKDDLIKNLLKSIPTKCRDKTVYLNINDEPRPFDFMSLGGSTPQERDRAKDRLVSDLKFLINRGIDLQHAHTVDTNLTNVIYTLLNYNENKNIAADRKACFLDIYWFLENEARREEIKNGLSDQRYIRMWKEPIPRPGITVQDIGRITSRMNPWASSPTLKAIFGAPSPPLRIEECYENENILLVNLDTDEISGIYGTLLISKLWEATKHQRKKLQRQRIPHFLFCDEFQNFQTSDFQALITEGRGLGLCLTLANQSLLDERISANIRNFLLEAISTFIIFRVGPRTATELSAVVPSMETEPIRKTDPFTGEAEVKYRPVQFKPEILTRLPEFRVLWRKADGTAEFKSTTKWPDFTSDGHAEYIKNRTRELYACRPLKLSDDIASSSLDDDIPADTSKTANPRSSG